MSFRNNLIKKAKSSIWVWIVVFGTVLGGACGGINFLVTQELSWTGLVLWIIAGIIFCAFAVNKAELDEKGMKREKEPNSNSISSASNETISRLILICSKAEMNASNFQAPLRKILETYMYHKNAPANTIKYFISPKIVLPDINNQMMCNMFIFTGLTANRINQPDNMSWNADSYKEGGYDFIVFDIKFS